jgi:alpha-D-ribose 1-methylphosphonate 5-triphosphate diphosphatase
MTETVYTNAKIILRDEILHGTIVVRDGDITQINEGASNLAQAHDFDGDFLLPGLVELHTDNLERHAMPRPGSIWPVDAAVVNHDREIISAGITTVCNAMSVGLINLEVHRSEFLNTLCPAVETQQQAGNLKAEHFLHLRCEVSAGNLEDQLAPLVGDPTLRLMSTMDHTPGQRQFLTEEASHSYYKKKYSLDGEALSAFLKEQRANQEKYADAHRAEVVKLAKERGVALASHDDATVEHVEEAVRDGITVAEFPTTVEAAQACRKADISVMMGGPNIVRGKSHSGNASGRHLAELGLLDIISSDYVPSSLLFAAFTLADHVDGIDLPKAVKACATLPAKKIGLDDRGELAIGKRADLVRVRRSEALPVVRQVWRSGERVC